MRVQFLQPVDNGHRIIQPGWVLEVSDPDGLTLIAEGKAEQVSNRTACRKGTSHLYDGCAPIKQDFQEIEQVESTQDEFPESIHIRHILSPKKRNK